MLNMLMISYLLVEVILENNKVNATVRRELGSDINAACGQLRKSYMDKNKDNKA